MIRVRNFDAQSAVSEAPIVPAEHSDAWLALLRLISDFEGQEVSETEFALAMLGWHMAHSAISGRRGRPPNLEISIAAMHYLITRGKAPEFSLTDAARWSLAREVQHGRLLKLWASPAFDDAPLEIRTRMQADVLASPLAPESFEGRIKGRRDAIQKFLQRSTTTPKK